MATVLGVDQSYSGLALTFLYENEIDATVTAFPPAKYGSGIRRLLAIQKHIGMSCYTYPDPVDLVCIEGYAYGSKFGREIAGELSATIRLELVNNVVDEEKIIVVAPKMLKKFVTGKGNAKKVDMIAGVKAKWGYETKNDNIADSFGLAKLAEKLLDSNSTYNFPYEKEVIDELRG
jgi:hypothetical protein